MFYWMFKRQMDRRPRFCRSCGLDLKQYAIPSSYNEATGAISRYEYNTMCRFHDDFHPGHTNWTLYNVPREWVDRYFNESR